MPYTAVNKFPGNKNKPPPSRADFAREEWDSFLTYAGDSVQGVEFRVKWLREKLAAANADAAILDPAGKKTAAQMEAEIDEATKAACLRSARKIWSGYPSTTSDTPRYSVDYPLKNIRECLGKAGAGLTDLDPENLKTADAVEAAFGAAIKKIYLNSARKELKGLEENKCGHDMSSTRYTCDNIRQWAQISGEGLEAVVPPESLPPSLQGASPALLHQHVEERMDAARRRTALLCAQRKFKEFQGELPPHGDSVDYSLRSMYEELAFSNHDKPALDPAGKSTAEDIDRLLAKEVRRCYRRTAESAIKDYVDRPLRELDLQVYFMDKINGFLENAGTDLQGLGMTDKYAPEILESQFAGLAPKAPLSRALHALENFEKCSAPSSPSAVIAMENRVTGLFNSVAQQLAEAHPEDPEYRGKIDVRIAEARERAWNFYCSFNGRVAVYKPLRLQAPGGG